MHCYVESRELGPPEGEPTLFEWAGGAPALTRMTRLFYEKYVPEDPLLAALRQDRARSSRARGSLARRDVRRPDGL